MFDFNLASFDESAGELSARLKALRSTQRPQQTELATGAGLSRQCRELKMKYFL